MSNRARSAPANPVLLALVGSACISSSAVLVSLADQPPGTTGFYRCALALPGLALLSGAEGRRLGRRSPNRRVAAALAGAFLGFDLVLWAHAIYDVGAGVATVLGNLQVVFVAALAWLVMRERPGRNFVLALPVVVGGVVLVSGLGAPSPAGTHPLAGALYGVATSISYSVFLLLLRRAASGLAHVAGPMLDATAGAAAAALVLGLALGEMRFGAPLAALGWLATLSLVSQTVGWLFITSALPRLPAAVSALLLLIQPAGSLVLAAAVLGQRPSGLQVLGAVLVCSGVAVAALRTSGRQRPVPAAARPGGDLGTVPSLLGEEAAG